MKVQYLRGEVEGRERQGREERKRRGGPPGVYLYT